MYRLGGHDGQFEELEAKEASVVSKFTERELSRFVPLTYVVAQTDVDLRFIPAVSGGQHQGLPNVPTGTLVTDSRIIGGERSFGRQDFYIVPQQGLKVSSNTLAASLFSRVYLMAFRAPPNLCTIVACAMKTTELTIHRH